VRNVQALAVAVADPVPLVMESVVFSRLDVEIPLPKMALTSKSPAHNLQQWVRACAVPKCANLTTTFAKSGWILKLLSLADLPQLPGA